MIVIIEEKFKIPYSFRTRNSQKTRTRKELLQSNKRIHTNPTASIIANGELQNATHLKTGNKVRIFTTTFLFKIASKWCNKVRGGENIKIGKKQN